MAKFILDASSDSLFQDSESEELINEVASVFNKDVGDITSVQKRSVRRAFTSHVLAFHDFIPFDEAETKKANFDENPNFHNVDKGTFDSFVARVEFLQSQIDIPANHEWGLRFYLGKNASSQYGIVCVPAHGLIPFGKNHSEDVEKALWTPQTPFFALLPSANTITTLIGDCTPIIANIDASGVLLTSFAWLAIKDLANKFNTAGYSKMRFSFGREEHKPDGLLILIISAIDSFGDPVIVQAGRPFRGICFDQGDLIPPPSAPVPGTTF